MRLCRRPAGGERDWLAYLLSGGQGYVKVYLGDEVLSLVQDPPREALVRLTAKGIDLMEGTLDDEGVAFGDPMRQ